MARECTLIAPGLVDPGTVLSYLADTGYGEGGLRDVARLPDGGIPLRCRIGFLDPATSEERSLTLTQSDEDPGDPWIDEDDEPGDAPRFEGAATLLSIGSHGCGPGVLSGLAARIGGRYHDEGEPDAARTYPAP